MGVMNNCDGSESAFDNYPDFSKHHSLVKRFLTPQLYHTLEDKKTSNGVTLDDCIQTGIDDPSLPFGLVAGDEECYTLFKDLYYPVIQSFHNGYNPWTDEQLSNILTPPRDLPIKSLDERYVTSTFIKAGRSFRGFPYSTKCTRKQRREVEAIAEQVLLEINGKVGGKFSSYADLEADQVEALVKSKHLFARPASNFMRNAGMARDWPDGRGIFLNESKSFLVWVNWEDHLSIIAKQNSGDLGANFATFCEGANQIGYIMEKKGYQFQHSKQLGYMCACPINVGTAMRCGVNIRLPRLVHHLKFMDILKTLRLEKRGRCGEYRPTSATDCFQISNLDRIGLSENELVARVHKGVRLLIKMEKLLEDNRSIDHLILA